MKNELIVKLRELLKTEEIASIRDGVREIRNDWKAETAKEDRKSVV